MKIEVRQENPNPNRMPLEKRDSQFIQIQQLIEAKRELLLKKQKKIKAIQKQNQFLDTVKDDYQKYYNYINKQKHEQINALQIINNYINDLTETGKLSKYNIEDAKVEQDKIMREVNSIRSGLDEIMDDTNYIGAEMEKKLQKK